MLSHWNLDKNDYANKKSKNVDNIGNNNKGLTGTLNLILPVITTSLIQYNYSMYVYNAQEKLPTFVPTDMSWTLL